MHLQRAARPRLGLTFPTRTGTARRSPWALPPGCPGQASLLLSKGSGSTAFSSRGLLHSTLRELGLEALSRGFSFKAPQRRDLTGLEALSRGFSSKGSGAGGFSSQGQGLLLTSEQFALRPVCYVELSEQKRSDDAVPVACLYVGCESPPPPITQSWMSRYELASIQSEKL